MPIDSKFVLLKKVKLKMTEHQKQESPSKSKGHMKVTSEMYFEIFFSDLM